MLFKGMNGYDSHVVNPSALPDILTTVALSNTLLPINIISQLSSGLRGVCKALIYK